MAGEIDFGFAPLTRRRAEPLAEPLAELWRRVRLAAETRPPCPCHGIVAGQIDPDVIEENMLAPLRTRYRVRGPAELVTVIERRLNRPPFAGLRQSFEDWLQNLADAPLGEAARARLHQDLAEALRSFADPATALACE